MAAGKKERIGDLLVLKGIINRATAEAVAVERVLADTRFASLLVRKGKAPEFDVLTALSDSLGAPGIDLARVVIARSTLQRIPEAVAKKHHILPVQVEGSMLLLAMADPLSETVIEETAFSTALSVLPLVALHSRIGEAIARAYTGNGFYCGPDADPKASQESIPILRREATAAAAPPVPEAAEDAGVEDVGVEIVVTVEDEPFDLARHPPLRPGDAKKPSEVAKPAAKPTASPEAAASESAPGEQRRVILVVDDEPDVQQLVVQSLKSFGHEILTASRGVEALNLVKTRRPDLIILDAMLPEVHGFEICRKIKESKRFADTPVLMISAMYRGWRMAADIKTLYGADAFLEKPFRVAELRRTAEKLLERPPHKTVEEDPAAQAKAAYDLGLKAYQGKDFQTAFNELRKAEAIDPFSSKIQFMLGRVLEQQTRTFQAIYHYERAVELNSSLFSAVKNLALLYEANGFKHKAVEMWERALRAAPEPETREQIKQHLVSIL